MEAFTVVMDSQNLSSQDVLNVENLAKKVARDLGGYLSFRGLQDNTTDRRHPHFSIDAIVPPSRIAAFEDAMFGGAPAIKLKAKCYHRELRIDFTRS